MKFWKKSIFLFLQDEKLTLISEIAKILDVFGYKNGDRLGLRSADLDMLTSFLEFLIQIKRTV